MDIDERPRPKGDLASQLATEVRKVVLGQEDTVRQVLAAWLCGCAAEHALDAGPFTPAGSTIRHLGAALRDCAYDALHWSSFDYLTNRQTDSAEPLKSKI